MKQTIGTCRRCEGSGEVPIYDYKDENGNRSIKIIGYTDCPECDGTGENHDNR